MKICLVASRGGHLQELRFMKHMSDENQYFLITEKLDNGAVPWENTYYVDHINRREPMAFFKVMRLFREAYKILQMEKPDCFISTGALISIPVLLLGKLKGKKVIFIETLARVESASISGRIAYWFADLFIVYWESMLKEYPKAVYINPLEENTYGLCHGRNTEVPV